MFPAAGYVVNHALDAVATRCQVQMSILALFSSVNANSILSGFANLELTHLMLA